ncbi:MAG: Sua5/YciO/YrdC/YwlC family protein [Candidatus Moduliflexus flocculans]|nr:Sua5/YciO/YrdC/YwlC family protein [Candidatus Moduliflexus flocculans]
MLDGGRTPGGLPSTIVDITGESPRILREGAIPAAAILALLG